MKASFGQKGSGIEGSLNKMLTRANTVSSYLDRVIFPKFQKAQLERFKSENASQGDTWAPLNPEYAKRKRKKYAAYPGAGSAILIATGRLMKAATGQEGYNKIVTNQGITIGVDLGAVPYAGYVGSARPFMKFSDATIADWKAGIVAYVGKGKATA